MLSMMVAVSFFAFFQGLFNLPSFVDDVLGMGAEDHEEAGDDDPGPDGVELHPENLF